MKKPPRAHPQWLTVGFWQRLGQRFDRYTGGLPTILRRVTLNYARHECSVRAAAIAYYILLSFFPLVLLLITVSSSFLTDAETKALVFEFVDRYLPSADQLVELNIGQLLRYRTVASVLSMLGLFWSGGNVFAGLHRALNAICDVEQPRSFWWQRLLSLASVGLILFTFALSLGLTTMGKIISQLPNLSLGLISVETGQIWGRVTSLIGFAPTILLFYTIYRLLSNMNMRWWEWVPGAVLGGLFWELGKQLFAHYVINFKPYNLIYGTLGKFIAFIIWSYYTGMILLIGAELSVVISGVWRERRAERAKIRQTIKAAIRRTAVRHKTQETAIE
ncbi:MAG: YihY/virulence factor BrkB family protein [Anaerolineae bacterium]|nr:YihY/virulence factor BrkB family protein [Anaerolineae bacterium]